MEKWQIIAAVAAVLALATGVAANPEVSLALFDELVATASVMGERA